MRHEFGSLADDFESGEDSDPRVGLVNLADVMLVLACGLMIALVAHWNVNLTSVSADQQADMQKIEDVKESVEAQESGGGTYKELGVVYQDPETGEMYLYKEGDSEKDN